MDCRTAQSLINAYINRTLTIDELEHFLKHVENCPSCYDELEIYFIVYYAMMRLDDKEGTFDMNTLLKEDIRRRKLRVSSYRIQEMVLVVLIIFMGSAVMLELLKMLGIFLL